MNKSNEQKSNRFKRNIEKRFGVNYNEFSNRMFRVYPERDIFKYFCDYVGVSEKHIACSRREHRKYILRVYFLLWCDQNKDLVRFRLL